MNAKNGDGASASITTRRVTSLVASLLLWANVCLGGIFQVTGWNFDWDDNILFMPTKIVLFHKATGAEKPVTTGEFAEIRAHLGTPGPWEPFETRPDPLTGSFRYFRDAPDTNHFLNDLIAAVESGHPEKWQGPSWDAFVYAMSNEHTARHTTIITARGHSAERMLEGLRYLQTEGFIRHAPPPENLYGVSHPKFAGTASDPSATKAAIMLHVLDGIQARGLNPSDMVEVVTPDGKAKRKMHLWGFSDDDFGNFDKAVKVLSAEIAKGRWPDIKITVFFTGNSHPTEKARVVVLTPDGGHRPILIAEMMEASAVVSRQLCEGLLTESRPTAR